MLQMRYRPSEVRSFPGCSPALSEAALRVMNNEAPDPILYNTTHTCLQAFKTVAARAASASPERLTFFLDTPADFVSNLRQPGQINDDEFFWGMKLKIDAIANCTAAQAPTTAPGTNAIGAGATPLSVTNCEEVRALLNTGRVNCAIGQRKIVDNVYGVHRFASGSGVWPGGAIGGVNSTNVYAPIAANNGSPDRFNGWDLTPWVWLSRGRTLSVTIDWNATNVLTTNSLTWCVSLEGVLITTGNV